MGNLENVKVGDLLVRRSHFKTELVKISRLTPTQIVVDDGKKYYKKNGYMVGNDNMWYSVWVYIPKEGEVEQIREQNTIYDVCRKVKQLVDKCSITYEQALKIKEILNV